MTCLTDCWDAQWLLQRRATCRLLLRSFCHGSFWWGAELQIYSISPSTFFLLLRSKHLTTAISNAIRCTTPITDATVKNEYCNHKISERFVLTKYLLGVVWGIVTEECQCPIQWNRGGLHTQRAILEDNKCLSWKLSFRFQVMSNLLAICWKVNR